MQSGHTRIAATAVIESTGSTRSEVVGSSPRPPLPRALRLLRNASLACALLLGCASNQPPAAPIPGFSEINPPHEFFEQPSKIGLVWFGQCGPNAPPVCDNSQAIEHASLYRFGPGGEYPAEEGGESPMFFEALNRITLAPLVQEPYLERFSERLDAAGFEVVTSRHPIDAGLLKGALRGEKRVRFSVGSRTRANFRRSDMTVLLDLDLQRVAEELGVQLLLVAHIDRFGAARVYFKPFRGVIEGWTRLRLQLLDLGSNRTVADYVISKFRPPQEPWNVAPHYELLVQAVRESLDAAFDEALFRLFRDESPQP
jgi:hypothetical protein